jgi:hypothetical protein
MQVPKTALTEEARRKAAVTERRQRVCRIIDVAAMISGFDRLSLAKEAGIPYQGLNRRMRCQSDFSVIELMAVADVLRLDDETRAALMGAKKKCRYEAG